VQNKHIQNPRANDKQKLMLALSDSVFTQETQSNFIYNSVWRLREQLSSQEINLY